MYINLSEHFIEGKELLSLHKPPEPVFLFIGDVNPDFKNDRM